MCFENGSKALHTFFSFKVSETWFKEQTIQDVTLKIYYWTSFYKLYSYIVLVDLRQEVLNFKSQKIMTQDQQQQKISSNKKLSLLTSGKITLTYKISCNSQYVSVTHVIMGRRLLQFQPLYTVISLPSKREKRNLFQGNPKMSSHISLANIITYKQY